jgi:hypothetical protein
MDLRKNNIAITKSPSKPFRFKSISPGRRARTAELNATKRGNRDGATLQKPPSRPLTSGHLKSPRMMNVKSPEASYEPFHIDIIELYDVIGSGRLNANGRYLSRYVCLFFSI